MIAALGVFLGGGFGALARYGIEGVIAPRQRSPFPMSTLIVNVTGSAILGALAGLLTRGSISPTVMAWFGIGLVGGYTTFSTFTYETLRLIEDRAWRFAVVNVALSGTLSFCAAAATYLALRRP